MLETITVSSRGQIVIPEKMRKQLGIREGSRVVLVEKEGGIIMKKEKDILKYLEEDEQKENLGWITLAEYAFREL